MSDNLLSIIDSVTNDSLVKSIITSESARQHTCKDWLIEQTEDYVALKDEFSVCVAAGWFGLMAHKFRQKYQQRITALTSFDRDKQCKDIGKRMYPHSQIKHEWQTIENFNPVAFDVVVSTSCEHVSDKTINEFIARKQTNAVTILQSNNYFSVKEHINCKNSVEEFAQSIDLDILHQAELQTEAYTRYMVVGR